MKIPTPAEIAEKREDELHAIARKNPFVASTCSITPNELHEHANGARAMAEAIVKAMEEEGVIRYHPAIKGIRAALEEKE